MSRDLLKTAERLVSSTPRRPRQTDLKRAISTAHYALFHAIAADCADRLIGTGRRRSDMAWTQVYRALQHGEAKAACGQLRNLGFPAMLIDVGSAFTQLQERRHNADYDPLHCVSRADAMAAILLAEAGIENLDAASTHDRKAFAVLLLFRKR